MHPSLTIRGLKCGWSNSAVGPKFGSTRLASAMRASPDSAGFAGWGGMRGALTLAVLSAMLLAAFQLAHAQTETVLYSFCAQPSCADGAYPTFVTPVLDKKGNLYGTTNSGGTYGYGTAFEVTPSGTETILHSFDWTDGAAPQAGLILDKKGNLYGTAAYGGYGYGTVFELTPSGTETTLVNFDFTDGANPLGSLIEDSEENLYGTTSSGGAYGYGTVFELAPSGTETVLYSFDTNGYGYYPGEGLVMDKLGNLYGTTGAGGAYGYGTVFELTSSGTVTILYSFGKNGTDGWSPAGVLVRDRKGNLYGTTIYGGAYKKGCFGIGCGTVFKLTPSGKKTILHNFDNNGTDGWYPYAGLVRDAKGNLYGTTMGGGAYGDSVCYPYGCGTVFKLTPSGKETILHSFDPNAGDGSNPWGGLVFDENGNLYGTTVYGGAYNCGPYGSPYGCGTVFKLTP